MIHPVRQMLWATGVCSVLVLSGCSGSSTDDLRQWMADQRNAIAPKVAPVSAPKRFVPQEYTSQTAVSPFSAEKLLIALRSEGLSGGNSALLKPELNRRKEPLELVPLDTMAMVGILDKAGKKVALVRVDKLLYQVSVGQYLGQNYGRVLKITSDQITLREIVQDATGDWVEHPTTLQLQEGTQK